MCSAMYPEDYIEVHASTCGERLIFIALLIFINTLHFPLDVGVCCSPLYSANYIISFRYEGTPNTDLNIAEQKQDKQNRCI